MTQTAPVSVEIPVYVAKAMHVLPNFLEAIQAKLMTIQSIEFGPDRGTVHDPREGHVKFIGYGNSSVTFCFQYRPGEEGTLGSVDKLEKIVLRRGEILFEFEYLDHYCGCRHCSGMKYPFRPAQVPKYSFENYSEEARLHVIRQFVGGVH